MQTDHDGSKARKRMDPKKTRKTLTLKQEECVKEFNRTLLQISKAMYNKNKLDNDVISMKQKLEIGIKEVPLDIFERAGEYIWNYRKEIAEGDADKFLKKDYEEEVIQEIKKENDGVAEESEIQKILSLIKIVKKIWRSFNATEQSELIKKFQELLKQYATHEDCRRQIKKIDDKPEDSQNI